MRRYRHLGVVDGGRARPGPEPGSVERRAAEPASTLPDGTRLEPPVARLLLALGSIGVSIALAYGGHAPPLLAIVVSSPLLAASFLAPLWAWASIRRFDRDLIALLARERGHDAPARLRRALGLRLFGAPEALAARQGMAAAAAGDPRGARAAFARAIAIWIDEDRAPVAVRLGHAHACHALGDDEEAEWAYRRLLATEGPLPRVRMHLAHARIRRGAIDRETVALLDAAERDRDAPPREIALVRALADAVRGRSAAARRSVASILDHAGGSSERERALEDEIERRLVVRQLRRPA